MATRHPPASVPGALAGSAPSRRRRAALVAIVAGLLVLTPVVGTSATAQEPTGTTAPGTTPPGSGLLGSAAPEVTPRDAAEATCLAPERPVLVPGPVPEVPYLNVAPEVAPATVVDSRGSTFDNSKLSRSGFGIGVRIRPGIVGADVCFVGGSIRTDLDPETTSWDTWHRVTAMAIQAPGFRVVGTALRNQGDVLAFLQGADDWQVVGVRVDGGTELAGGYGHDDCIEDDAMLSGVVDDSKFDGCFTFLSATQASEHRLDGTNHEVVVRRSLVRLQPYQNSFNVPKYGEGGHSGFFKWASTKSDVMIPPALSVSDSMFRADDPARYGGNENGNLGLPPGTRCENVVLIGSETWPPAELASWQDQCTGLRLGTIADWDAAVAEWDAAHPPMRDVAGQARDLLAGALGW